MLSSSSITTICCRTPAPRSADGTTTSHSSAGIANTTCHVKRCQEVYRRGRESVTCATYRQSARLHCTFGCTHTQKIHRWQRGRPTAHNHDSRHLRMSLDVSGCPWCTPDRTRSSLPVLRRSQRSAGSQLLLSAGGLD